MFRLTSRQGFLVSGLGLAFLLAGCAMPAQVRAPRTLEAGRVEHSVGLQLATISHKLGGSDLDEPEDRSGGLPALTPTYAIRVGLLDWLQLGARGSMASVGMELTMQLLKGRHLDLALGADVGWVPIPVKPAWHEIYTQDETQIAVSLPLLLGVNLRRDLTFIALAAPVYAADAAHLQFGGGLEIRSVPGIHFRPHVSYLSPAPFDSDRRGVISRVLADYHPYFVVGLDLAFAGDRGYGLAGIP